MFTKKLRNYLHSITLPVQIAWLEDYFVDGEHPSMLTQPPVSSSLPCQDRIHLLWHWVDSPVPEFDLIN